MSWQGQRLSTPVMALREPHPTQRNPFPMCLESKEAALTTERPGVEITEPTLMSRSEILKYLASQQVQRGPEVGLLIS